MRARLTRMISRAKFAAIGAAIGGGVGGLYSTNAASTGAAIGGLVGAVIGEKRVMVTDLVADVKERKDELTPLANRS